MRDQADEILAALRRDFCKWVSPASYINKTEILKGTKVLAEPFQ